MSGQVTITQLPTASALTGSELVPVVQNGVTAQTTTGAISGAGALNYPFLTVGSTSGLTQARYLSASTGLSLSDTGAGGVLTINMTGAASSLNAASTGIIVKNATNTVINRSLAVGSGMTISNADGISGNPTFGLSTILQNLASTTSAGMLALNGTTITAYTIQGITSQTNITNGNGVSGAPTIGLATDPVMPGTGSITIPTGTTAQRSGSIAAFRYNSELGLFEGYGSAGWAAFTTSSSSGVVSVGTGTGLTGGPITSSGTISIANTTVAAGSYTYASFTVNAQGQLTSASSGGTLAISGGGTGQTTASAAFNALSPMTTAGDIIYGGTSGAGTRLGVGTAGQVLTVNSGATAPQWTTLSGVSVTTFSGGTTGLLPSSATSGAITLTGTLVVGNGGTGLATLTAGYIPYGAGTSAFGSVSTFKYDTTNSTLNAPSMATSTVTSVTPTLSFNASNANFASGATISGSYLQNVLQNKSGTAGASTNYVLSNDLGTDSTYYGEFGMNSSVYSASTPADFFSINNSVYFSGHDGDVAIGSGNGFKTYLAWGTTGQSAHVINASGALGFSTNLGTTPALSGTTGFGTSGYLLQTAGSAGAPSWVAQSTITAGTATNVNLTAGTGATNYLHFSAAATGSQPTTTNTLLTYNYTNNTITAGISGGAF